MMPTGRAVITIFNVLNRFCINKNKRYERKVLTVKQYNRWYGNNCVQYMSGGRR